MINEIKAELEFDNESIGRIFGASKNEIEEYLDGKEPGAEIRERIDTIYKYFKEAIEKNQKRTLFNDILDFINMIGQRD